jgi:putative membrane protein
MKLTEEDHAKVAQAVAGAERGTSGEIRCVLADGRDTLKLALIAAAAALVLPGLGLVLGLRPEALLGVTGGWSVADPSPTAETEMYIAIQVLMFLVAMGLGLTPLARMATPQSWRKAWTHRAAEAQFEALGLVHTRDRTGVLLYVSLAHRRAEVLADVGIYEKAPAQAWDEVVNLLIAGVKAGDAADGFARAATRTGEILSAYLPPRPDDSNELPDGLVQTR